MGNRERVSFNRFGEDLSEAILSYLSFEEKVRFECVDKQFQRLVYNSVVDFEYPLNRKKMDLSWRWDDWSVKKKLKISEQVIKKCRFIRNLRINTICDSLVLAFITQNCNSLQKISLRFDKSKPISSELLEKFAQKYGKNLESIEFTKYSSDGSAVIYGPMNTVGFRSETGVSVIDKYKDGLGVYDTETGLLLLTQYKECFPYIRHISLLIDSKKSFDCFKSFADKYGNRMKSLELRIKFNGDFDNINEVFEQISHFVSLNTIVLTLGIDKSFPLDLTFGAKIIGKYCLKLKHISIDLREMFFTENIPILESIESLPQYIQSLSIKVRSEELKLGAMSKVKSFTNLTKLNILYRNLNDETITDIHLYCPKLESIELKTDKEFSNNSLHSMAKLSSLRAIKIIGSPFDFMDISAPGICALVSNCHNLELIEFEFGIALSEPIFLSLISLAESSPKRRVKFGFDWRPTKKQYESLGTNNRRSSDNLLKFYPILNSIPKNLTIADRKEFIGCGTGVMRARMYYSSQFRAFIDE